MARQLLFLAGCCGVMLCWTAQTNAQGAAAQGVLIDAHGVLSMKTYRDPAWALTRQRIAAARSTLPPNLARPSKMRKISLTRLAAQVEQRLADGRGLTDEMKYLAGLTRVRHIFIYPGSGDVVIAGPAEGFIANPAGRAIGMHTGKAMLELQDLAAALRAFPPNGDPTDTILVSIDPTVEGLAKMRQFLVDISGRVRPQDAGRIAQGLKQNLGLQNVRIEGISPKTHFAQVLVEADYRMKMIGIGLEQPPVRIPSYVSLANPRNVARNALQRWYFVPNYDCVRVSPDILSAELQGDGVQLLGEDQLVQANGARLVTGQVDRASRTFVSTFTKKYGELSKKAPVYAQMRNLIDLSIVAAYLQHHDCYRLAGWDQGALGDENRYAIEVYEEPRQVGTAVNAIWKGNTLMTPVGGGVRMEPMKALAEDKMTVDQEGQLSEMRKELEVTGLDAEQWWWD